jgi:phytoene dehydrogenase-like protein
MVKRSRYDVVIAGGGLNGLVAAAYLARAGRSVLVAERRESAGGSAATDELAPGFRASAVFGSAELFHPEIVRELGLPARGLELLPAMGGLFVPAGDDAFAVANGSRAAALREISRHSPADAEAYAAFEDFLGKLSGKLDPVWTRVLPDLAPAGVGDVLELLTLAFRLRGLGKRDFPEALRYLPMPIRDVVDERFETPALQAAIAGPALTASWLAPRSAGSALTLLLHRPSWTTGLLAPPIFVRKGLGALSRAISDAAAAAGAEIVLGTEVTRVLLDDEGRAAGVALRGREDGAEAEVSARAVVSNLDPRRTLLELGAASGLEPEQAVAAKNVRARGTVALVQLALGALPAFRGGGEGHLAGRIQIGATLDELERAFDGVKYGELPEKPFLEITVPTLADPSLAPEGKHVVQVWAQWVPYDLASGSWDERREELGDLVVARIEEHAPGFSGRIEHRRVTTPLDLERRLGCSKGCLYHAEPALDQMLFLRPMPGWYRYRTPIENLYLCGPGTHPGVAMTGLSGKNAAAAVLGAWRG